MDTEQSPQSTDTLTRRLLHSHRRRFARMEPPQHLRMDDSNPRGGARWPRSIPCTWAIRFRRPSYFLWAQLEELVGIIAVCLLSPKSPAERVLRRLGVLSNQFTQSISLPSFVLSHRGPDLPPSPVAEMPSAGQAKVVDGHSSASGTSRNDSIKEASDVEVVRVATAKDGGERVKVCLPAGPDVRVGRLCKSFRRYNEGGKIKILRTFYNE